MKKIILEPNALYNIEMYMYRYREYFEHLYTDTGIFDEKKILDTYRQQDKKRKREILSTIQEKLSTETVFGRTPSDTLLFTWRSKTIILAWRDDRETRFVTDVQIR